MTNFRKITLTAFAAPLALALSACGGTAADGEVAEAATVEPVAAPEGQEWTDVVNVSDYDGYILGNPDAAIKVVEYASLTCPACASFAMNGSEQLKSEYVNTGRVSYELRNQIHNGIDLVLARLVRCGPKEAFHPRSDAVWADLNNIMNGAQQNGQALQAAMELPEDQRFVATAQAAGLYEFFGARGLGRDQAEQCLADAASVSAIADNSNTQSQELGVTGTPTFFINGTKIDANSWTQIEPMLQRAGAR
ncbi:thioredoxin domain-containing protein [Pontixanthobacter aestiaquae]|uniref:Thioredoxin domain-containing protein n=1 Tax=Pontixanthobacter aestiaquae TaxID=1509367 RepID=A0A844ZAF9_9SPHN|nr:thioredoxin domain-containing protein [Pontixanthobacter aestiaquae]MDN3644946.1 thioredoxin domain-containing protein [Pontixanthobacter aestiaquae]MXO84053.1 thioredoxin domain-containing protein [Pontixanthobacter aestiaquae]